MSLPIYQHINVRKENLEDVKKVFHKEMNLKHPISFNIKHLDPDEQLSFFKFSESFFKSQNISFKFPYPIYFISDYPSETSHLFLITKIEELPKFYSQKESKLNVKETHLMGRNKLLQQEVINADTYLIENEIKKFSTNHQKISLLEEERIFYKNILNKLIKAQRNG